MSWCLARVATSFIQQATHGMKLAGSASRKGLGSSFRTQSVEEFKAIKAIWDKNLNFTDTEFKNYIHVGLRKDKYGAFVTDGGKILLYELTRVVRKNCQFSMFVTETLASLIKTTISYLGTLQVSLCPND
jgi:hypothetical protein